VESSLRLLSEYLLTFVFHSAINLFTVHAYGETEFWLSTGEVFLMTILFGLTFVTMVGGNPDHDAYGFRHCNSPGAFAEYASSGDLGRFEGFLECLWTALFIVTGPEYVSSLSAEAKHPRVYVKQAFKVVYWRSIVFFVGGAICIGILLAYDDSTLIQSVKNGGSSAYASPYIIAMKNMGITGLPHLACALMLTTVFSAGNTYWYATTRGLYSLAAGGRAPHIFTRTNDRGIPIYCNIVALAFGCLSFLQLSGGAMTVLNWLISLTTANILINYIIIGVTYICFYRACYAQGFDRTKLPYYAYFQPYCGYISIAWMVLMLFCFGYRSFTPWSTKSFFLSYTMFILAPIYFFSWKIFHGTKWLTPEEVDLRWEADDIALYEASETEQPIKFWRGIINMLRGWKPGR
jgi:amino acid transporter